MARPVDALTLSASYGYTTQKYTEYTDVDRTTDPAHPQVVDVSDLRVFSRAPKSTFNFSSDLRLYEGFGEIHIAGDLNYVDKYYSLVGSKRVVAGSTGSPDPRFPTVIDAESVIIPHATTIDMRLLWKNIPMG